MKLLRAIGRWFVRLFRWLFRRPARPLEDALTSGASPSDDELQRQMSLYDGIVRGAPVGGRPFSDLMPQQAPVPKFLPEDLFTLGTPRDRPQLDPRRQAALEQRYQIDSGATAAWRGGRHGNVVQMADGREALVLTDTVLRRTAERSLQHLVNARERVSGALASYSTAVDLRWPEEMVIGYDGGIDGYVAAGLGEDYVEDVYGVGQAVRTLATLDLARPSDEGELAPDDRLALVTHVGAWMSALHDQDVVFGQLSPTSVAFRRSDLTITPVDYVTSRVMGSGQWAGESITTSMDLDRKAFARLAMQVLIPESGGEVKNFLGFGHIEGLGKVANARVRWLFARASGVRGMPTVDEWMTFLANPSR